MEYRNLKVERRDYTALVILNRPRHLNALSLDLLEELEKLCRHLATEADVRVVVFTGAGAHFSAGADLKDVRAEQESREPLVLRRRTLRLGQRVVQALYGLDAITIAAINGGALGGAAAIATAMDFRIGADDSFVAYPEINLGMNVTWFGLPLCVRLIGPARAKRMVILGQQESATTLLEWGFLDEVVPRQTLLERAMALAAHYASQPPAQAQMLKRSINTLVSALDGAIMHMDFDQLQLATASEDAREARQAQEEKREANFSGR